MPDISPKGKCIKTHGPTVVKKKLQKKSRI
jgi:hypothetical protein